MPWPLYGNVELSGYAVLSVKQRSWLLSTEKRTKQSGKSPIIVEIRIINLRSLCSVYRK